MKQHEEYIEIHLKELDKYIPSLSADRLSEDFFISKISNSSEISSLKNPFRFDGYLAYFCITGKFNAEINLRKFDIEQGTLLLYVPGKIVSLSDSFNTDNSKFVMLAVSRRILQNAKVDLSQLYDEAVSVMSNPCINLGLKDIDICGSYYHLSEKLIHAAHPNLEASLLALASSLFHYLGNLWRESIMKGQELNSSSIRSKMIFEKFMRLVSDNHTEQREVGFYAEKLNMSPKYLSQLVKKISGQSAPDWISSFVIIEAKNYLKYSNLDVKEIAYKLHFSSTPVFFRYFKAHTGMTPLEYRKS
jgi:AraC-type DNA-binding domain-containing proteins